MNSICLFAVKDFPSTAEKKERKGFVEKQRELYLFLRGKRFSFNRREKRAQRFRRETLRELWLLRFSAVKDFSSTAEKKERKGFAENAA